MDIVNKRFFLQITFRPKYDRPLTFFRDAHFGKNSFSSTFKECFQAEGATVIEDHEYPTTHRLRGTMCALLIETGHSDSSIMERTGPRLQESLKHYQHLFFQEAF